MLYETGECDGHIEVDIRGSRLRLVNLDNWGYYEREERMSQVVVVAAEGFRQQRVTRGFTEDVRFHIDNAQYLFLLEDGSCNIEGFVCIGVFPIQIDSQHLEVLHIQGIVLGSKAKGLGEQILRYLTIFFNIDVVAFHTANTAMRDLGNKIGGVYNNPLALAMSPILGTDMSNLERIRNVEGDVLIERGRYRGSLYGLPLGSNLISGLDEAAGDAAVFAFVLNGR